MEQIRFGIRKRLNSCVEYAKPNRRSESVAEPEKLTFGRPIRKKATKNPLNMMEMVIFVRLFSGIYEIITKISHNMNVQRLLPV